MNTSRNFALITGASKGIGRAIAFELARRGHHLFLAARSADLLNQLKSQIETDYEVGVHTLATDLSLPGAPEEINEFVVKNDVPVDILVNNAGFAVWDRFDKAELKTLLEMNDLNVGAVIRMTHLFVPQLLQHKRAWIMNVSSTAACQPIPNMALYAAGKAYIRSFTRAIRDELSSTDISVTCLNPGGVWTDFLARAELEVVAERNKLFIMKPDRCARIGVNAMFRGKADVIPGLFNRISCWGAKHLPTSVALAIARRLYRKE